MGCLTLSDCQLENEMQSTMEQIHKGGLLPVTKEPEGKAKRIATMHDRDAGFMFAQRAIALMQGEAPTWTKLANELFGLTHEAREAAMNSIKSWKASTLKAAAEAHDDKDKKVLKRILGSATTRISQLSTIAGAINKGLTYAELAKEWRISEEAAAQQSIELLYDYAKTHYSESTKGRKADTFTVKLGKWLEQNKNMELTDRETELYGKLLEIYNSAV